MHKTLAQLMKPDLLEKRHCTELEISEKSQKVLISNLLTWSDSNVISVNFIADLLEDCTKGHGSLKEVTDQVQHFKMLLTNQNKELKEVR